MPFSKIIWPDFLDVDDWRQVVRNNEPIEFIEFLVLSNSSWMPLILSQVGFFASNSDVKRNRPDLWRDACSGELVRLGKWANIRIQMVE